MREIFESNPVLRQHQNEALDIIRKIIRKGTGKGKIILPTGTGKTRIEAETICAIVKHREDHNKWAGIHVVLSPRILLAYQQLDEFTTIIARKGIDFDSGYKYMVVNSGGLDSSKYEKKLLRLGLSSPEEIDSTTNKAEIRNNIIKSKRANVPLIIFSTYHSADRVNEAATELGERVVSYIFDEAQYCVTSGDFQNIPDFESDFHFFFTATEKLTNSDNGLGMNNLQKFGKCLFTEKPRTLIERGEMTSIALHLVGTRGQNIRDNDYESMAKTVVDAFDKHRTVMKEHSSDPDNIGPKMIIVCDKQESLKGMMRSRVLKDYRSLNPTINLCALSSDYGIEINGKYDPRVNNRNKEILLLKLRGLASNDEAIVFHVDMIAEGIDVPGITAVMPFRSLGQIKLLQNVGRGTRLVDKDRKRLYNKSILPKEWKKYVKPFCWLILPVISSEYYDTKRRYSDYVYALRSDYGFNSGELVIIDNIIGPPEDKPLIDMAGGLSRKFSTGAGLIGEIIHGIEDAEAMSAFLEHSFTFNTLSPTKQITMLKKVYAKQ